MYQRFAKDIVIAWLGIIAMVEGPEWELQILEESAGKMKRKGIS